MAKGNESTTKFKADISELKKAFQEAQRQVRLANAEFKAATAGTDDWTKSADGLSAKITQLNKVLDGEKKKLANLEDQYKRTVEEQGENSRGAQELAIKINNQRAAIGKVEKELGKYNSALEEVSGESKDVDKSSGKASKAIKDVGDSSKKAEKEASGFGKALGGALKKGLLGVAGAAVGAVAGFLASGEASQDFMEDMGKLNAGFTSSGHSAETAKKSYEGMVGILGETDQSVEAVNHLAKLTQSEEELAKWTDIAAGVYGTFGDSLPIEGLTEAANETAKVGQVTGPLADALNWAGISEDEFNEKLAACADEQERSTLITETLSETYRDAADAYKEVNGDLIAARQATSDMNAVMAEMGQITMPITTALKTGFTSLIQSMLPGLQEVGDGITGLINGTAGSSEKLQSGLQSVFDGLLGKITGALPQILQIGLQIITSLIQGIVNALPQLINSIIDIIPQITQALLSLLPQLVAVGAELIKNILIGLGEMLPEVVLQIIEIVPQIVDALVNAIPELISGAVTFLLAIVDAIPEIIPPLLAAIPQIIDTLTSGLQTAIPQLLEGAIQLLNAIVEALPIIIDSLVAALPDIIAAVINFFMTNIPVLWNAAIQLFMALVQAIPTICLELLKAVPQIVMAILQGLSQLPLMLVNFFTSIWEMIKNVFAPVVSWFKSKFETAWNIVKQIWTQPKKFFADLWTKIKEIFSKVGDWFKENFGKAWDNVKSAFEPAKNFFANVWSDIKSAFSAVKSWFSDTFSGAWEGIKSAFSSVKSWFSDLWSGIKSVFSGVGDWFGDTFDKAVSAIKAPINYVIDALNYLIRGMNKISFDIPDWVPGVGGKNFGIDIGEIPKLAMGGIIDKPTTAIIGEDGREAVIPLENNTRWLDVVASKLATKLDNLNLNINGQATPNVVNNFYQTNNSPKSLSRLDIYRQSKNLLSMKGV